MSPVITSAHDVESLTKEVTCMKMLLACMLKSMGQVDAGKAILRMERQLSSLEEGDDKALFSATLQQIKTAYLA
ncbi:DUF2594 family protein [Rosenbergiella australiborealis]|uniref:DUF2594 family protein n=1 Tax=Rosenbergiella australiborealis TaxID=1544696 RepID=A0ABS5T442_9GAMM|nr:DUF2594 family protein [Rosenbergiella australiborealis]MBT0726912.1 DUF2594 family protein [Rosenbergiella australiborealis]